MLAQLDLNLTITNNVNYPVQINVLGGPYNLLDTSNAKTEYQWDVTSFAFGLENEVTIEYKINGAAAYSTYSGQFAPQTLQAVVDVLNGLGIGFFSLYTVGANTYIGTYNDQYTFGNLNIFSSTTLFGTGFDGPLFATTTQADGKIVCTGAFTTYNGTPIPGFVVRLNTDGTIDTTFASVVGFDSVPANVIQLQTGELLFAGGNFTTYNGITTPINIVKISSLGVIDATFSTNAGTGFDNGNPQFYGNIIQQPDGNILMAGTNIIQWAGSPIGRIIRITDTGLLDLTFEPSTGTSAFTGPGIIINVTQIALNTTNGKIYCIGDFNNYTDSGGPNPCNQICVLNSNGTFDATFVGGVGMNNPNQSSCFVQPDGKLVIGGGGNTYQGTPFTIIRINPNGTIDTTGLGTGFNAGLEYVSLLNSGNIICSGIFTDYNGTSANGIIILTTAMAVYSVPLGTGFFTGYAYNSIINPASATVNLGGAMQAVSGGPLYITQITV